MELVAAVMADLDRLTRMNILLREDERMDNFMTEEEVRTRMTGFLEGDSYRTFLLKENEKVFGYILLNIAREPVYLRHLYVERDYRKKGLGRLMLKKSMNMLNLKEIDLEVMVWNDNAVRFYEKYGFKKRYIGMRYMG